MLTPLSDLITRCVEAYSQEVYGAFLDAFVRSEVGVVVTPIGGVAAPLGPPGHRLVAGKNQFGYGATRLPDGREMLLACADFHAFRQRFGGPFNATVLGREVLVGAWANAGCQGISVSSAASEHSMLIARDTIGQLLAG